MSAPDRVAIRVSPEPCWDLPGRVRPFVFRSAQPLLSGGPWVVRYGEDGARCFATAAAAVAWATRHHADLVRGLNPETGTPR